VTRLRPLAGRHRCAAGDQAIVTRSSHLATGGPVVATVILVQAALLGVWASRRGVNADGGSISRPRAMFEGRRLYADVFAP
jgi:hypothetical protein